MTIPEEIAYYNALPVIFDGFVDLPELTDGVISLNCSKKNPADPVKNWVPSYAFDICKGGAKVGETNLRVGYTEGLYYSGNIGYMIEEAQRGNGYAVRACKLLAQVAQAHGMTTLLITTGEHNTASMRVCEKLGARLLRTASVPEWHDLYHKGGSIGNIYEWSIV